MIKSHRIAVAALAIGLAACSSEQEPPGAAPTENVGTGPGVEAGSAVDTPTPTSTPTPTVEGEIPSVLRGRWGLAPADCTSTQGDAKGLLTIGADKLEFYESVAELETVDEAGADRIEGSFHFTGEGQTWNLDVSLSTPDGGETLVRQDSGPDAQPGPLTYTRCP
jgi:hypothetical protein